MWGGVTISQVLTFTINSSTLLLLPIFFSFDSLIPSLAILGYALREDGTDLPRAAVPSGYPMPADGPWATLCLSSRTVGAPLPGL